MLLNVIFLIFCAKKGELCGRISEKSPFLFQDLLFNDYFPNVKLEKVMFVLVAEILPGVFVELTNTLRPAVG